MYETLRSQMVATQLIPRGISDTRVLAAMQKVERHRFVPPDLQENAYDDCALPIGEGQTISQPYMVAIMTELLNLKGTEKVLEIGTGSGYQAAILAELAKEVYTIDRIERLSKNTQKLIGELGYKNITVLTGDGTLGYEKEAPYGGIIVTAASPIVPKTLVNQLSDGGRLVIPVGNRWSQVLTVVAKENGEITTTETIGCVFVPLIGKYGWAEEVARTSQ